MQIEQFSFFDILPPSEDQIVSEFTEALSIADIHEALLADTELVKSARYDNKALSLLVRPGACPNCGGSKLIAGGYTYTRTGKAREFQSKDCSSYSKG